MRFVVAVSACVLLFAGGGCSKFAGQWLEEGRVSRNGDFVPAVGPRRMALEFDWLAVVRSGAYVDAAGVVDSQVVSSDAYLTMKNGNIAQFGSIIATLEGDHLVTFVGTEESRRFVRVHGPSIFPPQVSAMALDGG